MMVEAAAGWTTVLGAAHEGTKGVVRKVAEWKREAAMRLPVAVALAQTQATDTAQLRVGGFPYM